MQSIWSWRTCFNYWAVELISFTNTWSWKSSFSGHWIAAYTHSSLFQVASHNRCPSYQLVLTCCSMALLPSQISYRLTHYSANYRNSWPNSRWYGPVWQYDPAVFWYPHRVSSSTTHLSAPACPSWSHSLFGWTLGCTVAAQLFVAVCRLG